MKCELGPNDSQAKRGGWCGLHAAWFTLSTLAAALLAPAATVREHGGQEADLIVHHGNVVTVDRDFSVRQAMAIKDGLILRVGTDEEILQLKGPRTELIIRFHTVNNAWLMFREKDTGSLEAGKLADFIVLDTDLLTCASDAIPRAQVLRTYLGGKLVYARDAPGR